MRLLLIEDDSALAENVRQQLVAHRFSVDLASNGEDGLFNLMENDYDLAIIDIGLPVMSGIDVIKEARQKQINTPVLILTARNRWQEKVEGLDAGADDYLTKPFHPEELLARANALIRRASGQTEPEIKAGPVTLNTRTHQVKVNGHELELTAYEYKVIEYLMLNPEKVISKTELTEHIYDQDFDLDSNVIEVFILRLRKKLCQHASDLKPINTLRGRGYQFNIPVSSH